MIVINCNLNEKKPCHNNYLTEVPHLNFLKYEIIIIIFVSHVYETFDECHLFSTLYSFLQKSISIKINLNVQLNFNCTLDKSVFVRIFPVIKRTLLPTSQTFYSLTADTANM